MACWSAGSGLVAAIGMATLALAGCGRSEVFFVQGGVSSAASSTGGGVTSGSGSAVGSTSAGHGSSSAASTAGSSAASSTGGGTSGSSTGGSSTGGSSTGSTGGSSTGTNTGGSTGGGPPVCLSDGLYGGDPCGAGCTAPLVCADDPLFRDTCVQICQKSSDCNDLSTVCVMLVPAPQPGYGVCLTNLCGPGTGNGSFDSVCNATGTNDGTCVPYLDMGSTAVGLCLQGGDTPSGCCGPCIDRQHLINSCPAGQICYLGVCGQGCDPTLSGQCNFGDACTTISDFPPTGVCPTTTQCP